MHLRIEKGKCETHFLMPLQHRANWNIWWCGCE